MARKREDGLYRHDLLNALQELTDIPRTELDGLYDAAMESESGAFFSVKHQILITGILLTSSACVVLSGIWLF